MTKYIIPQMFSDVRIFRKTLIKLFIISIFSFGIAFVADSSVANAATVDVLVVYDSTASSWVADFGGEQVFAQDAIEKMNQATSDSDVDLTFRLAHAATVSYTHTDLYSDYDALADGTGGLSVAHDLRQAHRADLVVMFVDTGSAGGHVGQGSLLTSMNGQPDDRAYSVNAIQSVWLSQTLTHEVGHNLGAHHSKNQDKSPGPNSSLNSYSAGWYFQTSDGFSFHTIMAYDDDGYGNMYTEAPVFSSPQVTYFDVVAGDAADGDNARTISETMDVIAAYSAMMDPVMTVVQSDLVVNESGTVDVTIEAPKSDSYYIKIIDDDGFTAPEWSWPDPKSIEVQLDSSQQWTHTFSVTPDDLEEGFDVVVYEKTVLGLHKAVGRKEVVLTARQPDVDPPTVHSLYGENYPSGTVHMTFSEGMDTSTLNDSSIQIVGSSSGLHSWSLGGGSQYNTTTNELTIKPDSLFYYSETVTVSVTTGVADTSGNHKSSQSSFNFTIQDEPVQPPSSINLNVSASDTSIDPGQTITVSGTATYDTGAPVTGTATIFVGSTSYTASVTNSSFSRTISGPTASGNIIVNVTDGTLNRNSSLYIQVDSNGSTPSYDLETHVTYDHRDEGNGYVSYWTKDAFRSTDDHVTLLALIDNANLSSNLDFKWKYYRPDGQLYGSVLDWPDAFNANHEWGWAEWGYLIEGNSMASTPGKYKVQFYVDGDRKATHSFVIAWDFVAHNMAKDIDSNWLPVNKTNTFSPNDVRAISVNQFEKVAQGIDIKTEFYSPSGSLYAEELYSFPDDLGAHEWYDWRRNATWIYIKGHAAEYMCGDWSVKFYIKNPVSGNWEHAYTDSFKIYESTSPIISDITHSPASPVGGENVNVAVSVTDNNHLQRVVLHWNDGSNRSKTWDNINSGSFTTTHAIGAFVSGSNVTYWVEAFDESGNFVTSGTSAIAIAPEPITVPSRPSGESFLLPGATGTYTTGGSSAYLGGSIEYQFDWGDGQVSNWGASSQQHSWSATGDYSIRVRSRSSARTSTVSTWSSGLVIGVNTPPTVENKSAQVMSGQSVSIVLSGNDADGDSVSLTLTQQPANGSLSGTLPALVYTPNAGYVGSDSFAYQASDGMQSSNIGTVSIVVGDCPMYYVDADRDGYGDLSTGAKLCDPGPGYVQNGSDADDNDPTVYPGAHELCDGKDNDQDGEIDEECSEPEDLMPAVLPSIELLLLSATPVDPEQTEPNPGWRLDMRDMAGTLSDDRAYSPRSLDTYAEAFSVPFNYALSGDVTGDGKQNLVVSTTTHLHVYDATGNKVGEIETPRTNMLRPILEDLDGDGVNEILVGSTKSSTMVIDVHSGDGTLLYSLTRTGGSDAYMQPSAYLGNNRLAVAYSAGYARDPRGYSVWNLETRTEEFYYDIGPTMAPFSIAVPVDGGPRYFAGRIFTPHNGASGSGTDGTATTTTDGDLYLIVIDEFGNEVLTQMLGNELSGGGNGSSYQHLTDLDGDGTMEILATISRNNSYKGTAQVRVVNLDGTLRHSITLPETNASLYMVVTDIEKDGTKDVVVMNWSTGVVRVLDPTLNTLRQSTAFTPDAVTLYSAADVDGDGVMELFIRENNDLVVLDGASLAEEKRFSFPSPVRRAWACDLNGDASAEIVVTTTTDVHVLQ